MPIISHSLDQIDNAGYKDLVQIKCDICNAVFTRPAKQVKNSIKRGRKGFFCSADCRSKGHVSNGSTHYEMECHTCHTKFISRKRCGTQHVFCSRSCAARFNKNGKFGKGKSKPGLREYFRLKKEKDQLFPPSPKPRKSRVKKSRNMSFYITAKCHECGTEIVKRRSETKKAKHGMLFCSKSCRMRYYNVHILKRTSNQRSHAEDYLIDLIKKDFPFLNVLPNDRAFLPSGLEIDIYIPDAKLAIELNGPVHYLPIYGENRLEKVQLKDSKKFLEIHDKGLSLMVLDISRLNSKKQQHLFLDKYYEENIKSLLS